MADVDWRVRDDRNSARGDADAALRLRESAYSAWERSTKSGGYSTDYSRKMHHGYADVRPEKDVVIIAAADTWSLYARAAGDAGESRSKGDLHDASRPPVSMFRGALSDLDVTRLSDLKKTKAELEGIRLQVERHGQRPETLLTNALRANRVVGVGDLHATPNPQRDLGARMMSAFASGGATHVALELPRSMQPDLDRFALTGDLEVSRLPVTLRQPEYMRLLRAARESGLRLTAVDEDGNTDRDGFMAREVTALLDADPSAKVILWVGSNHLQSAPGRGESPSAAELLKGRFPVFTVVDQSDQNLTGALARLTRDIKQATAVPTAQSAEIAGLDTFRPGQLVPQKYGYWDAAVIYPSGRMRALE